MTKKITNNNFTLDANVKVALREYATEEFSGHLSIACNQILKKFLTQHGYIKLPDKQ